jgi:hypothetical protein
VTPLIAEAESPGTIYDRTLRVSERRRYAPASGETATIGVDDSRR